MALDFVSVFLQKFLEIVVGFTATALAGLVVALLTKVINDLKIRLSSNAQWIIGEAIRCAVLAAEQVKLKDFLIDKKDFAIKFAQDQLAARGIKLDLNILSNLIEAAVMDEFNRNRAEYPITTDVPVSPESDPE